MLDLGRTGHVPDFEDFSDIRLSVPQTVLLLFGHLLVSAEP
jgi:hypothetical protein